MEIILHISFSRFTKRGSIKGTKNVRIVPVIKATSPSSTPTNLVTGLRKMKA